MEEIYLVDGSCFIYRAYHAIKPLSSSKGILTNAIYGFTRMLLKLIKDRNIKYMLIALDSPHPTKRHRVYEEYKITRPETPKDLPLQIEYIKSIIEALGIMRAEIPGYEADDIIATVASQLSSKNTSEPSICYIVTLDKDMLQIVSENTKIYDPFNNLIIDRDFILKKYGIEPEKLTDFMAMVGDNIDNIPGIKGIGEKTAAELLKRYGSVENILKNLDIIKPSKIGELIRKNKEILLLSQELVSLKKDAPIEISLKQLEIKPSHRENLRNIFKELEFHSLLKEIQSEELENSEGDISVKFEENQKILEKTNEKGIFSLKPEETVALVGVEKSISEFSLKDKSLSNLLNTKILKIIFDAKEVIRKFKKAGLELSPPFFDLLISAYLLNPNRAKYDFIELCIEYLGTVESSREKIEPLLMLQLYEKLSEEIKEKDLERLYYEIEMPLVEVLLEMEEVGIMVNLSKLNQLTELVSKEIDKVKDNIYSLAGIQFNINSPKQLAEILYDKLGLKTRKRGKKARSTEMEVLEELSFQHDLPREIISYRILNKLLTSYLTPLKSYINPQTGRIHAKWSQTTAGTGRIVSSEPNLQNIPVKGQWAEHIREIFVPQKGFLFLSADYSQIELRLLSHLSGDKALIEAFRKGKDIHRTTASEIFSVPEESVTDEQRRVAKTVNFGITYGISPFGLSESVKIPYEKAEELIELYFSRYPNVRDFIAKTIEQARKQGYVRTLFGRIRPLPDIGSANQFLRTQAERMAVNATVQGTAADIIKIAMIRIYRKIKEQKINAKLVLQIHDEIVLEVEDRDVEKLREVVINEMKNFSLQVPLEVNVYVGESLNL
jgi:DNA polymerase-1